MYCSNFPRALFKSHRNHTVHQVRNCHFLGRSWIFSDVFQAGVLKFYSAFNGISLISSKVSVHRNCNGLSYGMKLLQTRASLARCIKLGLQQIPVSLKEESVHIVRVCTQQCECVLAHRIRRCQQMFSLYSKLWDEGALKEIMLKMRQQLSKRGKDFLLGAVGVSVYNWEKEKIPDEELLRYLNELDLVYELRDFTITCPECHYRTVIDVKVSNVEYCHCDTTKGCDLDTNTEGWEPFLERDDLLVWRKEVEEGNGLYKYKVYGKYPEVSAEDFLNVQIDTEFRRQWDDTAVDLKVVEQNKESNSDIVYWEMKWPRMFSNRDYVFNRRFYIDQETNTIVLINKGTEHPKVPEKLKSHRVKDYWSCMVIKANTSITEPGIEFSLTYFDNPGVSVPASITSWVAKTGLPDFQMRLRQAAREYKKYIDQKKVNSKESGLEISPKDSKSHDEKGPESKENLNPSYTSDQSSKEMCKEGHTVKSEKTPSEPSGDQPSSEHHTVNPSSSRMHLKQLHAWQLFI